MHPGRFEPGDLDFFVPQAGADVLTIYVVAAGYDLTFKPPPPDTYEADDWDNGYCQYKVLDLYHKDSTPRLRVNIVVPYEPNVLDAIMNFHSTVVINYIAHYGHVCLYPEWTNASLGAIRKDWDCNIECVEKYRSRGYDILESLEIPADFLGVPDGHKFTTVQHSLHQQILIFGRSIT